VPGKRRRGRSPQPSVIQGPVIGAPTKTRRELRAERRRQKRRRLGAVGIAGVVVSALVVAAAVGFGVSVTMVKSLTRTEQTLAIMFWMLVVQSTAGLLPALYVWTWPPTHLWGWVLVIAFCGTFSHYCMARAMLHADATVVIPMDFLRVPLSATAGWLIYSERLDLLTVLGAALILTGNLLNLKPTHPTKASAPS